MRTQKDYELEQAFSERAKAKNQFVKIANNKKSKKTEILESYKQYKVADDKLVNIYEGMRYDKVA